jgi:putative transposase
MRGPKPPGVELTDLERKELQRLVKRHLTPQQIVLRARIVLAAADGANNGQIARRLGVSLDMVRRWRERWIALEEASLKEEEEGLAVEERLTDAPRPGKPRTITPEQECQIIALACESPQEGSAQRPISQWTGREIAEEIERRGICETISARHAGRLLKRGISNRI